MPAEATVMVRERIASENVTDWLEAIARPSIISAHTATSPLCLATEMEYLKIPIDDNFPIGNRRKQ
jgi:hypothetical protein